jgi:predicted enzyme related to lactoylglutathione lyase
MDPVVHFEMPADDRERIARFYSSAFGWQTQLMGEDFGNYVLAMTTDSDDSGPKQPGAINGGFFPREGNPQQHPSVVIQVEDIQAAMNRVREAGGEVLGEPQEIPGVGRFVPFTDTEGNQLSMMQPAERP